MAIALNNTIQNLRFRFTNGPAGQFLSWWGEELRNALPAQLRAKMQYARRHLQIQLCDGQIDLSVDSGGSVQALDSFSADQDPQLQQQQIQELLQQHELAEISRDYLLAESDVLRIDVTMPLATEGNLRQALAYEMDRHTPFQANEVFYNWRVQKRDREAAQLHFELFVTLRAPVEAAIEKLRKLGLAPSGVDVASDDGALGINLLPEALRFRIVNERVRANSIAAGIAVLLMVIVMAQSLWLREHQLDEVGTAIDEVRAEAMQVQQVRKQIEDASEAAGFLQVRRINNGYKIEMLAELTGVLPADTYLDRLTLNANTIQIQGKSDNAQDLIELINLTDFFEDASFRGPTRLDNRSKKEIFDLSANLSGRDSG
jgi:general secretion pathway protein L